MDKDSGKSFALKRSKKQQQTNEVSQATVSIRIQYCCSTCLLRLCHPCPFYFVPRVSLTGDGLCRLAKAIFHSLLPRTLVSVQSVPNSFSGISTHKLVKMFHEVLSDTRFYLTIVTVVCNKRHCENYEHMTVLGVARHLLGTDNIYCLLTCLGL